MISGDTADTRVSQEIARRHDRLDVAKGADLHDPTARRAVLPTARGADGEVGPSEQFSTTAGPRTRDARPKTHASRGPRLPSAMGARPQRGPIRRRPATLLSSRACRCLHRNQTGDFERYALMSIPPYEPPKSSPSPGPATALLCPKCAGVMKTYERNGIHLEQCDTCRGIFLDFGELESLTQMENRFVQAAPPPPPPVQQGYGSQPGYEASRATGATTTGRAGDSAATSTTASRGSAGCSSRASLSASGPPQTMTRL